MIKLRKKVNKIIRVVLASSLFLSVYTGMLSTVYAAEYKNQPVGYIQESPEEVIEQIDTKVNKMTAENTSVKEEIKIIPTYTFAPAQNEITAKSVIEADSENNKGYGFKYKDEYLYWSKDKNSVEAKFEDFKAYLNSVYSTEQLSFLNEIKIDTCFYKTEPVSDFTEMINKIGFKIKRSEIYEAEETIPCNTVYVYGLEDKVRVQGKDTVMKYIKEKIYEDESLIEDKVVREEMVSEGISNVIETSDKSKITYTYDASVLCLPEYQTSFLNQILPVALKGQSEYHIPVSLTLAQAVIESGWGINHIQNNLYGFKAYTGWTGAFVPAQTTEYVNGERISVTCYFKGYNSFEESVEDYIELIGTGDYYKKVRTATNYIEAAKYMGESKYATSPTYGETILNTINTYGLYVWDNI